MQELVKGRRMIKIRQEKEWTEILTRFETRNRYSIRDEEDREIGKAAEEEGGLGATIARNFLGPARSCRLHVFDVAGREMGLAEKPFRFYFWELECSAGGRPIGRIRRVFHVLGRRFLIEDPQGRTLFEIKSPFLHPWTFEVHAAGREVARISKRWSGAMKEIFTDADDFGIEILDRDAPEELLELLLFATFLVDFTCFEKSRR